MTMRAYLLFTTVLFALIGMVHLMRFLLGWTAVVGTWTVPSFVSLIAVALCAVLAIWGGQLLRRI